MTPTNKTDIDIKYTRDKHGFLKQMNPKPFDYNLSYKASQSTNIAMSWLRLGWLLSNLFYGRIRHFNMVDIGSGNGSFVDEARKVFKRAVPYDLAGKSIDESELYSTRWDVVVMSDVLEHYSDIDMFWTLQFKYAMISFPETPKDYPLEDWKHYKPNEHIYCLNRESFEKWVKANGCEVIASGCPEDAIRKRWDNKKVNVSTFLIKRGV